MRGDEKVGAMISHILPLLFSVTRRGEKSSVGEGMKCKTKFKVLSVF